MLCKRISLSTYLIFASFVAAAGLYAATSVAIPKQTPSVVHQLRIYEIFDINKPAFHARFRDHAVRIMAKYDFKIVAIWETRHADRTEFAYLLEWPDRVTMTDRWAKFMADREWAEIKKLTAPEQGRLVGNIDDRTLELTQYSPRTSLLTN